MLLLQKRIKASKHLMDDPIPTAILHTPIHIILNEIASVAFERCNIYSSGTKVRNVQSTFTEVFDVGIKV